MEEIYVSTDIETDGPIPGEYSMLSFGSAAFVRSSNLGSAAISPNSSPGTPSGSVVHPG
jgi:hypothetical protein